jgi:uncharacterized protein YmfQ (DUF2313 family)
MNSWFRHKDYFVCNIRQVLNNKDWQYVIDIHLPQNKESKVWKNLSKFRNDLEICKDKLINIGFENSTIISDNAIYQIAID